MKTKNCYQTKRLLLLMACCLAFLAPHAIRAQATCATSTSLSPNTSCTLTDYSFAGSDTVRWFSFTADSQAVFIDVEEPVSSSPTAHVHTLELYSGGCGTLTFLSGGDINSGPAYMPGTQLRFSYKNLTIGLTYYIRVTRNTPAVCAQSLCTSSTAYFSLCVQNQSAVVQPLCIWPGPYNCGEIIGNGGFEYIDPTWNGTGCPFDITQNHNDMIACQWEPMPIPNNFSTPDFFNSCSNPSNVGVPSNGFGYQAAHSGNGYTGLTGWAYIVSQPPPYFGFEGIMQYFTSTPLVGGKVYFEEMYVSLADISNMATTIGFTSFPPVGPNDYYHPTIISDTTNWTRVAHCFTAIGGETERVITSNANTLTPDTTLVGATGYTFSIVNQNDHVAYFFIDDVVLRPLAYAGPDVTQCAFNTTVGCTSLSPILGATYSWTGSGPGGITIATPTAQSTSVTVTAAGTYTFIITVGFGSCSDSDTMTFTVTGFTSVINASTSVLCNGGSSNLSITNTPSTGPFTYAWGPPSSGLSAYNINNPVATPTATTTYAVIVHNTATGCNSLAFTTIFVSSPSVTIVPPLTDNTCDTSVYTANATGGVNPYSYAWSTSANGTILGSSTTNPITVGWSAVGAGSVTVTITDSVGCTASDTLGVLACCINDTGLVFSNDTASRVFGTSPGPIAFRHFNINGTFWMDQDMQFIGCNFNMGPNANIIVYGGSTLHFQGDTLKAGCCEMWDGVIGQTVNDTIILEKYTYLGDAIRGVVSNSGSVYRIFNNVTFNRNYVSITVNPYAGNHGGTVEDALFTSLNVNYCPTASGVLLAPYSGQWPLYGIQVTNVDSITVGNPSSTSVLNRFAFLRYGIRTKQTNIGIYNNRFVNIDKDGTLSKAIWCGGRYLSPPSWALYTVRVGGDNSSLFEKNIFTDCPFGVYTDTAMTTIVYNNTFKQTYAPTTTILRGTAIRVDNCIASNNIRLIDIKNDSIISHLYGYYGNQNNACTTLVWKNVIIRTQPGTTASTGVYNISTGFNAGPVTIKVNRIIGNAIGVRLNSVALAIIDSNVVKVRPTPSSAVGVIGIMAVNSGGIKIRTNYIALENPASPPITSQWVLGIYVGSSTTSKVTCNIIDSLGVGMCFEGSCLTSTVFDNDMASTFTGIWLNNGGVISQQGSPTTAQDNTWSGAITRRLYTAGTTATIGGSSPFYYRAGAIYLPLPSTTSGASTIIPTTLCTGIPAHVICPYVQPQSMMAQQNEDVINGEFEFPGNQDAGTWISREGLYRTILDDSIIAIGDTLLTNFKDSASQANLGKLATGLEVNSLGTMNSTSDITNAYAATTTLIPDGNVEQNYQAVESILLGHLQNGSGLTPQEIVTLRDIAQLCPFTDGNAVYIARGLLAPIDSIEYKGPCEEFVDEESGARMMSSVAAENSLGAFELYPNPTNGTVIVNYQLAETESGQLKVYTMTGSLVTSIDLENTQQSKTVTLPQLDAGVYLYKVTVNGELKLIERLIIIK